MITLGTKYLDYGLTGGVFLVLTLVLFGPPDATSLVTSLNALKAMLSANELDRFDTLIDAVIASFLVVCLFATGLILDLTGAILVAWEGNVLRVHLVRNRGWIEPMLAKYQDYLGEDIAQFLSIPIASWRFWERRFWRYSRDEGVFKGLTVIPQMRRIEGILLSHLLLNSDHDKVGFILDQLRTCRLARAVSSGTYIMTIVSPIVLGYRLFENEDFIHSLLVLVLVIVGLLLSIFVVQRAYSRFCASLFSSIYVLEKADERQQSLPADSAK